MPQPHSVGATERTVHFTAEDMVLFAEASGDHSPLHMDPAFGRRTAFGQCIVFGGLETIAMLGALPPKALAGVRSVRSTFPGPVLPGEHLTAHARSRPDRPEDWEVRLTGRGKLVARLVASSGVKAPVVAARSDQGPLAWAEARGVPDELAGDYATGAALQELAARFGAEELHPALLDGIAWASQVVGMSISGFDGLCASVTLVAAAPSNRDGAAARQRLRLLEYDERSDRLLIEGTLVDANGDERCLGLIECFPFSPTPLPETAALRSERGSEPVRGKAVVIGGSRGIGAALALALLSRGYEVHIVYAQSVQSVAELQRLAGDHAANLHAHQVDAADPAAMARVAESLGDGIDGVALCAAEPPLPMGLTAEAVPALATYVAGAVSLLASPLAALLPRLSRRDSWVLFLSSADVIDPPRETPQSITAKSALEGLARWVASTAPTTRVVVARPLRARTDLANTPRAREAATPAEAIADALAERLLADDTKPGLEFIEPVGGEALAR